MTMTDDIENWIEMARELVLNRVGETRRSQLLMQDIAEALRSTYEKVSREERDRFYARERADYLGEEPTS